MVVGRYVWAGTSTGPINIYDVRKRTLVKTARWVVFSPCWVLTRGITHVRVIVSLPGTTRAVFTP